MTLLNILNTLLPATGLVFAVWIAMRLLRLNAATRYAAWWVVLSVVLIMPFTPRWIESAKSHDAMVSIPSDTAPVVEEPVSTASATPSPAPAKQQEDWTEFVLAGYFVITGLLLCRLFVDFLRVRKMVSQSKPLDLAYEEARGIRLLSSSQIETPLAAGFWRPAILFPADLANKLTLEELRHIVVHEAAHISRRDHWTNLLGKILQAVCWPHPLVMIIINRIEVEREHACDDWVVAATGQPASYARSLARLVELVLAGRTRQPLLASPVIGKGPRVSKRVETLLDKTRNFGPSISVPKLTMSLVCLAVFVAICTEAPMLVAVAASPQLDDIYVEEPQAPPAPPAPPTARSPRAPNAPPPAPPAAAGVPASPEPPEPPEPPAKPGFLAALGAAGYNNLSVEEIIELKNHGIDAKYIREMADNGWGRIPPRDLVNLRSHGVSAEYLRDLKQAGVKGLTLERAIEYRSHGVNARTITEIHSLGFGPYTDQEVLDMSVHGMNAAFFRSLKENGIAQISAKDALEATRHGLTGRSIVEARKYGPNLSFEQILKLKRAGVI